MAKQCREKMKKLKKKKSKEKEKEGTLLVTVHDMLESDVEQQRQSDARFDRL